MCNFAFLRHIFYGFYLLLVRAQLCFVICLFMRIEGSAKKIHLCVSTGPCYEDRSVPDLGGIYGYRMRLSVMMRKSSRPRKNQHFPQKLKTKKKTDQPWRRRMRGAILLVSLPPPRGILRCLFFLGGGKGSLRGRRRRRRRGRVGRTGL